MNRAAPIRASLVHRSVLHALGHTEREYQRKNGTSPRTSAKPESSIEPIPDVPETWNTTCACDLLVA